MSLLKKYRRRVSRSAKKLNAALQKVTSRCATIAFQFQLVQWTEAKKDEPIRLVFYILTPQVWPSLKPLWECASKDPRFRTKVVLLENINADNGLAGLILARKMLEESGIPFCSGRSFGLKTYAPHVVFLPLPYPSLYPKEIGPKAIKAAGARIAYVPYGLEVGGGAYNASYQYNSTIVQDAWRVFARSDAQMRSFGRHCSTGNAHVVVTGHPRVATHTKEALDLPLDVMTRANGRKIVIWAPHFSVATARKWSSFLDNQETILAEIEQRTDLFFVLRPHPFLRKSLRFAEGWNADRVSEWFSHLSTFENLHLDNDADYLPAFQSSAAMMSDAGSFLVEYLLTDKPICHLQSADAIGLTEEAQELKAFYSGRSAEEIRAFLDVVSEGTDQMHTDREAACTAYFGLDKVNATTRILDEVAHAISDRPIFAVEGSLSVKHEAAFAYLKKAKTTFLAPAEYYDKQENLMANLLNTHKPEGFAVDIGCGNGRFTEVLARYCEHVEGVDPGPNLINEAIESSQSKGISNIEYRVERLEQVQLVSTYDLVSCMGVLSGIIDNDAFLQAARTLRSAMKPSGMLLLKDSLSISTAQSIETDGYIATYRNIEDYLSAFSTLGFDLKEEVTIAPANEKGLTNRFFLFSLPT